LVEHDLAKVGVAGSSPVFRSESSLDKEGLFFDSIIISPAELLLSSSVAIFDLFSFSFSVKEKKRITLHRSVILLNMTSTSKTNALVVELVDTQDLKSCDPQRS
jgi:hypothetical protein